MGFVGFTYLIIFLVILYYVILLAILAGGFALFYWGLRSHRKPENEKKAWPIILKISGIAIMAFMLVAMLFRSPAKLMNLSLPIIMSYLNRQTALTPFSRC